MTWVILSGAILALIVAALAYLNFAAQTVTKPLIEGPAKTASR